MVDETFREQEILQDGQGAIRLSCCEYYMHSIKMHNDYINTTQSCDKSCNLKL